VPCDLPSSWTVTVAGLTLFLRLRIDLFDLAKAIGFGIVRPGDERSAHFRAVPAGHDAEPKRLFHFDVTRREILHGLYDFQVGVRSLIERLEVSDHSKTRIRSALVGEPGEIRKYSRDQIAMMGISRSQIGSI
jgi:hypothetical protein